MNFTQPPQLTQVLLVVHHQMGETEVDPVVVVTEVDQQEEDCHPCPLRCSMVATSRQHHCFHCVEVRPIPTFAAMQPQVPCFSDLTTSSTLFL